VDYTGVKLGDVTGWAPTPDDFAFNKNYCVNGAPNFFISGGGKPQPAGGDGNIPAITALKDGTFDALYIYADQVYQFLQSDDPNLRALADGFGTEYAFIQFGLEDWTVNGTTLTISKRGSGLGEVVNPCIKKVSMTQNYTTLCEKYFPASQCIQNQYSTGSSVDQFFDNRMNARTDNNNCASGYCTCAELP
jgi:hypothetical protein